MKKEHHMEEHVKRKIYGKKEDDSHHQRYRKECERDSDGVKSYFGTTTKSIRTPEPNSTPGLKVGK